MPRSAGSQARGRAPAGVALVVWWLVALSAPVNAQSPQQGQNTVYNASGTIVGSTAFIEASVFGSASTDICAVLNGILSGTSTTYPANGAVIDARGLPGATGTSMTCGSSPWFGITTPTPATILLPAGIITIPSTWVLPYNTRLIGEGDGTPPTPSTAFIAGTTIRASNSFTGTSMIQFGPTTCPASAGTPVCIGISVANLTLDGGGLSINGIVNQYAQDASYVDHVGLYQITGIGLKVEGSANSSGPYAHISFDTGNFTGLTGTVCAQILSVTQTSGASGSTRGIQDLTCVAQTHDPSAAILLDSSNNSIKDVKIVGFYDGIRVGSNAPAESNVLINILGNPGLLPTIHPPVYTVHISSGTVEDLVIMGLTNVGGSGTYSLADDSTSTYLSDSTVGLYALGESTNVGTGNAYSRFTTSPNVPTWVSSMTDPPGGSNTCARGSLYSCVGGTGAGACTSGYAFWDCTWIGATTQWTHLH